MSCQWLDRREPETSREELPQQSTGEALTAACEVLEMQLDGETDVLLRGFRWFVSTYTQYYLLTYVLWHLCVEPVGPNVERAWKAVEGLFELADQQETFREPGRKWGTLERLKEKATLIREQSAIGKKISPVGDGGGAESLAAADILTEDFGDITADFTFGDGADWEMGDMEFPSWSDIAGRLGT